MAPPSHEPLAGTQLRGFQRDVVALAREQNVVMVGSTGIGKTFVAIALLAEQDYAGGRRAVFMAPTRQLVAQICAKVQLLSTLPCRAYFGQEVELWDERRWAAELRATRVLVCTPEIVRNVMEKGYVPMERVNLLVFDECHHVTKRHPYAQLIKMYDPRAADRMPRIFGTTACPTKGCAEALFATLQNVELDAQDVARYAAAAPILFEVYPKTWYSGGAMDVDEDRNRSSCSSGGSIEAALRESMDAEEAQLCAMLWDELAAVKALQVCGKLLVKGRSKASHTDAGREKVVRKFVRRCFAVYKNLGAWCYYRFVELEVERLAMAASLLLAVPGSMFGLDKDAVATLLLLQAKRSKCDFAATAKVLKIEELVWAKLLAGDAGSRGDDADDDNADDDADDADDADSDDEQVTPARAAAFMVSAIAADDSTSSDDSGSDAGSELDDAVAAAAPPSTPQLQGIVFVQSRTECRVLSEYLNEKFGHRIARGHASDDDDDNDDDNGNDNGNDDDDEEEAQLFGDNATPICSCMLGQASVSDAAAFNLPTFQKTLTDFESGATRVLISTSVSVEGVDFPLCGLIIVADRVDNARMLIQLRGRARHEDGVVFYLAEEGDSDHRLRFRQLVAEADEIKGLNFASDKNKSLLALPRSVAADKLLGHPFSPDQTKIVVESTGAKLDLDSSVACVNQFCQSLPPTLFTVDYKSMYSYKSSTHGKTPIFKATLTLPPELELGPFESGFTLNKPMAKAAAAFVAGRTLWEKGLLDDAFNSVYRKAKGKAAQSSRDLAFFLDRLNK
ncbi:hypothetical protein PybrP1_008087 [[Pythium] brassicae (nom. inval.)]|nr:hypothetical protein PybrP1_008087 [[Pythium] brassicae (nom. inval.)]